MRNERLLDLVRYQRSELHAANLISDEEYVWLVEQGSASARRLESYDEIREKMRKLEAELKQTKQELENFRRRAAEIVRVH